MPTYEYACERCESEFEVEQRITDDPLKSCPQCRSRKVKRLISRTSFVLKGGGWYSDLYGSPGARAGKSAEASGDAAASSGDGKGESATPPASSKDAKDAKPGQDGATAKGGKKPSGKGAKAAA